LSVRLGLLISDEARRQDALLRRLGLPCLALLREGGEPEAWGILTDRGVTPLARPSVPALMEAMLLDKKTVGGRLRFVLARSIGSVEVREVAAEDVAAVLGGEGGCCAS
jgi:3-dehydroquinate synthetase